MDEGWCAGPAGCTFDLMRDCHGWCNPNGSRPVPARFGEVFAFKFFLARSAHFVVWQLQAPSLPIVRLCRCRWPNESFGFRESQSHYALWLCEPVFSTFVPLPSQLPNPSPLSPSAQRSWANHLQECGISISTSMRASRFGPSCLSFLPLFHAISFQPSSLSTDIARCNNRCPTSLVTPEWPHGPHVDFAFFSLPCHPTFLSLARSFPWSYDTKGLVK